MEQYTKTPIKLYQRFDTQTHSMVQHQPLVYAYVLRSGADHFVALTLRPKPVLWFGSGPTNRELTPAEAGSISPYARVAKVDNPVQSLQLNVDADDNPTVGWVETSGKIQNVRLDKHGKRLQE